MNQPLHTHDCNACRFLGTVDGLHGPSDLYIHPSNTSLGPSVISRFGSDGPEYTSIPAKMLKDNSLATIHAELYEAARLAGEL